MKADWQSNLKLQRSKQGCDLVLGIFGGPENLWGKLKSRTNKG